MKHSRLCSLLLVLSLCACYHAEIEVVELPYSDEPAVSYDFPEDHPLHSIAESFTVLSECDVNVHEIEQTKASSLSMTQVFSGILSYATCRSVHQVVGTYESVDVNGRPVTLSGKLYYPTNGNITRVIIASHYTIGSNSECPSESFNVEGYFAALGYAVVMTDYLGFGQTVQCVHPYLQAEVCACNAIDMAVAVRPFLRSRSLVPQSEKIVLLGYSQGAPNVLHVMDMIENSERYESCFSIHKTYAGDGPYDIRATYDSFVRNDVVGFPCVLPMCVIGADTALDPHLDMSEFFREPLLSNYDEWINSKKYTIEQIAAMMGSDKPSEILTPAALDTTKPATRRVLENFDFNSVSSEFQPKSPLFLFHSRNDDVVPFVNSEALRDQFGHDNPLVTYDFSRYGGHILGACRFFLKVAKDLS